MHANPFQLFSTNDWMNFEEVVRAIVRNSNTPTQFTSRQRKTLEHSLHGLINVVNKVGHLCQANTIDLKTLDDVGIARIATDLYGYSKYCLYLDKTENAQPQINDATLNEMFDNTKFGYWVNIGLKWDNALIMRHACLMLSHSIGSGLNHNISLKNSSYDMHIFYIQLLIKYLAALPSYNSLENSISLNYLKLLNAKLILLANSCINNSALHQNELDNFIANPLPDLIASKPSGVMGISFFQCHISPYYLLENRI